MKENKFRCPICKNRYCKRQKVIRHMYQYHDGNRVLSCDVCHDEFESRSALQNHLRIKHPSYLSCDQRSRQLGGRQHRLEYQHLEHVSSSKEERHRKELDTTVTKRSCRRSQPGRKAKPIATRISQADKIGNRLYCKLCQKSFKTMTTLDYHLKKYHSTSSHQGYSLTTLRGPTVSETPEKLGKQDGDAEPSDTKFICRHCVRYFSFQNNFNTHLVLCHSYLKCSSCEEIFPHVDAEAEHREMCHPELSKICGFCWKVCLTKESRLSHMTQFHSGLKCRTCKQWFQGRKNLYRHAMYCNRAVLTIYQCHLCDHQFQNGTSLSSHTQIVHASDRFRCHSCAIAFPNLDDLSAHESSCDGLIRCTICNTDFNTKTDLSRHVTESHLKCHICNTGVEDEAALSIHMSTFHIGEKPFRCSECDRCFTNSNVLKVHMAVVHNSASNNNVIATDGQTIAHKYHVCKKGFSQYGKTHSVDAHLQCGICRKRFKSKKTMMKHMNTFHIDESVKGNIEQYIIESTSCGKDCSPGVFRDGKLAQGRKNECSPHVGRDGTTVVGTPSESSSRMTAGVDGPDEGYISSGVFPSTCQPVEGKAHTDDVQNADGKAPLETYDMLVSFLIDETKKVNTSTSLPCEELGESAGKCDHTSVTNCVDHNIAVESADMTRQEHDGHGADSQNEPLQCEAVFLKDGHKLQHTKFQKDKAQEQLVSQIAGHSHDNAAQMEENSFVTQENVNPVVQLRSLNHADIDQSDIYLALRKGDPNGDVDMRLLQSPVSGLAPPGRGNTSSQHITQTNSNLLSYFHAQEPLSEPCDRAATHICDSMYTPGEERVDGRDVCVIGVRGSKDIGCISAARSKHLVTGITDDVEKCMEKASPISPGSAVNWNDQQNTSQIMEDESRSPGHDSHAQAQKRNSTTNVATMSRFESSIHATSPSVCRGSGYNYPRFNTMRPVQNTVVTIGSKLGIEAVSDQDSLHEDTKSDSSGSGGDHDVGVDGIGKSNFITNVPEGSTMPPSTTSLNCGVTALVQDFRASHEIHNSEEAMDVEDDSLGYPRDLTGPVVKETNDNVDMIVSVNIEELVADECSFIDSMTNSMVEKAAIPQTLAGQNRYIGRCEREEQKHDYQSNFQKFCEKSGGGGDGDGGKTSSNQLSSSGSQNIEECSLANICMLHKSKSPLNEEQRSNQSMEPSKNIKESWSSFPENLSNKKRPSSCGTDDSSCDTDLPMQSSHVDSASPRILPTSKQMSTRSFSTVSEEDEFSNQCLQLPCSIRERSGRTYSASQLKPAASDFSRNKCREDAGHKNKYLLSRSKSMPSVSTAMAVTDFLEEMLSCDNSATVAEHSQSSPRSLHSETRSFVPQVNPAHQCSSPTCELQHVFTPDGSSTNIKYIGYRTPNGQSSFGLAQPASQQQTHSANAPPMNYRRICQSSTHQSSGYLQEISNVATPRRCHTSPHVSAQIESVVPTSISEARQMLKLHTAPEKSLQIICGLCQKLFPSGEALSEHKRVQHSLRCAQCGEAYIVMLDLINHYETCLGRAPRS